MSSERIVIDAGICNGKPVIQGTRITLQSILEFLAAGDSIDEILANYPGLERTDIEAALEYSSRMVGCGFSVEPVR